jgi:hypothetical protein
MKISRQQIQAYVSVQFSGGTSDRGLAQIDLERAWARAMSHSRRAGSVYTTSAVVFIFGQVKFSTLVPVADAPLWEVILWLSSAALLLPTLLWLGHAVWREWQAYRRLEALIGHPGAAVSATAQARLSLIKEFCRAGRG